MNEVRAPNYELALVDYQQGMKYKDIAENYGVTLNTVKSWKTRYKWSKDNKKSVHTKKKKVCTQRGGQPGNKNAVGNSGGAAPQGNKNAVTTGEYEALFFDALEDDEKQLIEMVQLDKEQLLLQEIQLLTVRERRMMKRIDDLKQSKDRKGMTAVKYKSGKDESTEYTGVLGQIQSIEDALTRVQTGRQKAIDSLHKYGYDDARLDMEMMRLELEIMKHNNPETETADDHFMDAMNGVAAEVWGDADD